MSQYLPSTYDNRGTDDSPFGFVYLKKNKVEVGRICYGKHRDDPRPLAIWPCRETPHDMKPNDILRIRMFLAKKFPELANLAA